MEKEEDQGFKILGFATGWYNNYCSDCGKEFVGEKRAFQCLSCAVESVETMQLENAKLRGQLSETEEKLKRAYENIVKNHIQGSLKGAYCRYCEAVLVKGEEHKPDCIVLEALT